MALHYLAGIFSASSAISGVRRSISCSAACWTHSPKEQPHADPSYHGQRLKRFGYEPHFHQKGTLPRLRLKEARLRTMPVTIADDGWSKRDALTGQNDFIHILGDERIKPGDLLTNVPEWLRGQKGREYSVLMRKRQVFEHWKWTKPHKWNLMQQRINFLYRRINNKYKPPPVEQMARSRH